MSITAGLKGKMPDRNVRRERATEKQKQGKDHGQTHRRTEGEMRLCLSVCVGVSEWRGARKRGRGG